jgi:hypothetical protein
VLEELLRPHGLAIKRGPARILQIVRPPRRPPPRVTSTPPTSAGAEAPAPEPYVEQVIVRADAFTAAALTGDVAVERAQLAQLPGAVVGDPARVFHSVAGVSAPDDFTSEFSVRGSAPRHTVTVVDGVPAPWIRHAMYGGGDTGSLTMIGMDAIERAVLHLGGGPLRDADRLGAQIDLVLREGARDRTMVRGAMSSTAATLAAEGPLATGGRGSWLLVTRQSLFDWPTRSVSRELPGTSFGYRDVQAKLAFDVRPAHHLTLSVVGGHSRADEGDEGRPRALGDGTHAASLVNAGWRAEAGPRTAIVQRVYFGVHRFRNVGVSGEEWTRGRASASGYLAHVTWTDPRIVLQTGGQMEWRQHAANALRDMQQAAYAHVRLPLGRRFTLSPGLRVSRSSRLDGAPVSRWIQAIWHASPRVALNVSGGVLHQFTSPDDRGADDVVRERATYGEVSATTRLGEQLHLHAAAFVRRESLARGLANRARGIELSLRRAIGAHVTGAIGYSYARAESIEHRTAERFAGDFDPGHGASAVVSYQREGVGGHAAFRYATNVPIAGAIVRRDDQLFAGSRRNAARLPPYARLDLRVSRRFALAGQRAEIFGEVLNVLGRRNLGPADGVVDATTGRAEGFTEPLLPRLPSIGLTVTWSQR